MTALTRLSFPSAADGYSAYIRAVEAIPPLTEEEEQRLTTGYRQKNDLAAARKLAMAHLRLVVSVARGYNGYGIEQSDLVQEGNIGLLKAVQKYDPARGARLATFAVYWIRAEIHNFIMRNWRIVKIATTKAQRKLFFHMRRLFEKDAAGQLQDAETIAQDLGVRAADVAGMRARVRNTSCIPFSAEKRRRKHRRRNIPASGRILRPRIRPHRPKIGRKYIVPNLPRPQIFGRPRAGKL